MTHQVHALGGRPNEIDSVTAADASECRTRIWRVVQDPRRIDHVESTRPQAWIVQVGFDELYLIKSETSGSRGG